MKTLIQKPLVTALLMAGMGVVSNGAIAAPLFSVNESFTGGTKADATITDVDRMSGSYNEATTITAFDPGTGAGTFQTSLYFDVGTLHSPLGASYDLADSSSRGGITYDLYALYQGGGTFVTTDFGLATESTEFTFLAGAGTIDELRFYADMNNDSNVNPLNNGTAGVGGSEPSTGGAFYSVNNTVDDVLLALGATTSGNGNQTCTGDNNCGSYGVTSTFNLVDNAVGYDGSDFFVDPIPFYNIQVSTGQFNGVGIAVDATTYLLGSQDSEFVAVPEPTSIALLGFGLIGLGLRHRKQAK